MCSWSTDAAGAAPASERRCVWVFADVTQNPLCWPGSAHQRGWSSAAQGAALQLLQQSYTSRDQVMARMRMRSVILALFPFRAKGRYILDVRAWSARGLPGTQSCHRHWSCHRLIQHEVKSGLRRSPRVLTARRARAGAGVGDPLLRRPRGGAAAAEQVDRDGAATPGCAALRRRLPARARHLHGARLPGSNHTLTLITTLKPHIFTRTLCTARRATPAAPGRCVASPACAQRRAQSAASRRRAMHAQLRARREPCRAGARRRSARR